MSLSSFTRKLTDTLSEVFSNKEKTKKRSDTKYRKLLIDPLEERQMLAVSAVMPFEQFANTMHAPYISPESEFAKYLPATPTITTNLIEREAYDYDDPSKVYFETYWGQESMAGNNQGDFVIVWSQNDFIVNPLHEMWENDYVNYAAQYLAANPDATSVPEPTPYLVNPQTKLFYDNWNVYARYFTDESQRISLPDDITPNAKGEYRVALMYAPYEVQKLTLTTATAPEYNTSNTNIVGTFELGFDVNGDKQVDGSEKIIIEYNELDGPVSIANQIQAKLRALDPSLAEIEVTPTSTNEYVITFYGDAFRGENVSELQVSNSQFTSGFLAGALVTTTSEPLLLTEYDMFMNSIGILIDPDNPEKTAASIQTAFTHQQKSTIILSPGVEYYSQERGSQDSSSTPRASVYTAPTVNVRVVDDLTFDITFVDGSGKIDHQELVVMNATGKVVDLAGSTVTTLKQNSTQFMVNDPEPDNPLTAHPEALSQMNATVAMDADGDFVITWQGEVRGLDNKITTNVYARRFSPQAYLDSSVTDKLEQTTGYLYSDGYVNRYETNFEGFYVDKNGDVILDDDGKAIAMNNADGTYRGLTAREIEILGKAMDADGNIISLYDSNGTYKGLTQEEIAILCGGFYNEDKDIFVDPDSVGKMFTDDAGKTIYLYDTYYKGLTRQEVDAIIANTSLTYDENNDHFSYISQYVFTNDGGNAIKLYQETFKALTEREIEILCGSFYDADSDTFLDADGEAIQDADENDIKLYNTDGTFKGLTEAEVLILCGDFYNANRDIFTNVFGQAIRNDDGNNITLFEITYKPLTAREIQILCGSFYNIERDIFLSNGNAIQDADGNDIKLFNANNVFVGLTEAEVKIICASFYDEYNDIFTYSITRVVQDGYGNSVKLYDSDGTYKGLSESEVLSICNVSGTSYYQQYDFFVNSSYYVVTDDVGNIIRLYETVYKALTEREIEIICNDFYDKDKDIFLDVDGKAIQDAAGKDIKMFNPDKTFKGLTEAEIEAICASYPALYDNVNDAFIDIFGQAIKDDDGNDIKLLNTNGTYKGLTEAEIEILCKDFYDKENDFFAVGQGVVRSAVPVQGVRAVGETFRVNTMDNGHQMQPAIGMDAEGNYVIAWSNFGQNHSYFSGIMAKWYDRDGNVISGAQDIQISEENTGYTNYPKTQPSVTLSRDGHVIIAWYEGEDQNYGFGGRDYAVYPDETQSVFVVYAPNQYDDHIHRGIVGGDGANAYNANVAFDVNNRFLITYTLNNPYNIWLGETNTDYSDVYAESYQISEDGSVTQSMSPTLISALYATWWDLDSGRQLWAMAQLNAVGGFDADGDMVFAYQGYGPDFHGSSINRTTTTHYTGYDIATEITKHINANKNSDLLNYFNLDTDIPSSSELSIVEIGGNYYTYYRGDIYNDVDTFIRDILATASSRGANNEQLGRLNAVLESIYGMMRGAGNDIMTTRINTGSQQAQNQSQSSDAVVNSTRDGSDTHFYIMIPQFVSYDEEGELINYATGGNVILRISRTNDLNNTTLGHYAPTDGYFVNLPLTYDGDTHMLDAGATYDAWFDIFNAPGSILGDILTKDSFGNIWPESIYTVRLDYNYYSAGSSLYAGTEWQLNVGGGGDIAGYWVYEVAFQHGAHDTAFDIYVDYRNGQSSLTRNGLDPNFRGDIGLYVERSGYQGTEQKSPSIHVLPNGSYVVSWVTDSMSTNAGNLYNNGTVVDRNINYRVFKESQDQAGSVKTDAYYVTVDAEGQYVGKIARDTDSANGLILQEVSYMVFTFDEELCTDKEGEANWDKSVLNPDLWVLLDADGNIIEGAIESISFGMNQSMQMFGLDKMDAATSDSMFTLGSNKWEAVITFDKDLTNGVYTLVAKKEICDLALNQLGLQGYKNDDGETYFTDGTDMTQTIFIVLAGETEIFFDHGDAPAGYGDAFHIVNQNLKLGSTIVAERVANYSENADMDDDDDGLVGYQLIAGEKILLSLDVTNNTGKDAYVSVWIDVNNDGVFDESELFIYSKAEEGVHSYGSIIDGVEKFLPNVTGDDAPTSYFMRVRLTTDENIGIRGLANDGEVEDYIVGVLSPSVSLSGNVFMDLDANGVRDEDTEGVMGGWLVYIDKNNDGKFSRDDFGELEPYTFVNVDGTYSFTNLLHDYAPGSQTIVRILTSTDQIADDIDSVNGGSYLLKTPGVGYQLVLEAAKDYVHTGAVYRDNAGRMYYQHVLTTSADEEITDLDFSFYPKAVITIGNARVVEGNATSYGAPIPTLVQLDVTMTNNVGQNVAADVMVAYETVEAIVEGYLNSSSGTFFTNKGLNYRIVVGHATPGVDYEEITAGDAWVLIPGEQELSVTVPLTIIVYGDNDIEYDEVFDVMINEEASYAVALANRFVEGTVNQRIASVAVNDEPARGQVLIINNDDLIDYGNIPFGPTTLADYGARHSINTTGGGWVRLGTDCSSSNGPNLGTPIPVDPEDEENTEVYYPGGVDADNDGVYALVSGTPENGTYVSLNDYTFLAGTVNYLKIKVSNTTGQPVYLAGWFDYNQSQSWNLDAATVNVEQFIGNPGTGQGLLLQPDANGEVIIPVTIPSFVSSGEAWVRFRISTDEYITIAGMLPDGEVEDYKVGISSANQDYGSAPDYGSVSHNMKQGDDGVYTGPHLGNYVDGEPYQYEGVRSAIWIGNSHELSNNHWGDNAYGDRDDDGVLFNDLKMKDINDNDLIYSNVIYACSQNNATSENAVINTIKVMPSEEGYLSLWIDYNGNGWFDDTEHYSERVSMRIAGSGDAWSSFLTISPDDPRADADGYVPIDIYVPDNGTIDTAIQSFARFRFTNKSVDHTKLKPTDSHPNHFPSGTTVTGPASNGEVEDYAVVIITSHSTVGGYVYEDQNYNGVHSETSPVPDEINLISTQGSVIPLAGESQYVKFDTMGISGIYSLGFEFRLSGFVYDQIRITDQGAVQLLNSSSSTTITPGFTTAQGYTKYVATFAPFLVSFGSFEVTYSYQTYLEEGIDFIITWTDVEKGFSFGVHLRNSIDEEGKANDDGDFLTVFYNGIPKLPTFENTDGEIVTATAEIGINFGTNRAAFGGVDYDAVVGGNALETQAEVDRYFNSGTYHWYNFTYDQTNDSYYRTYRFDTTERSGDDVYSYIDFVSWYTNVNVPNMLNPNSISIYTDYSYTATWSDIMDFGFGLEVGGARYYSFRISENGRIGLVNAQGYVDAYINVGASALQSTQIVDLNKGVSERGNAYIQIRWNDAFGVYIENDSSGDIITFFWSDKAYHDLSMGNGRTTHNSYDISVQYVDGTSLNIIQDVYRKIDIDKYLIQETREIVNKDDLEYDQDGNAIYKNKIVTAIPLRQYDKTELYGQKDFNTFLEVTGGEVSYRFSAITGFIYNNEPGINGQNVSLYLADENGDKTGNRIAQVQSDKNGNYEFTGLYPGRYVIEFDKSITLSTMYIETTVSQHTVYVDYGTSDSYDFGFFDKEKTGTISLGDVNVIEGDKGDTYAEVPVYLTGSFGIELNVLVRPTTGGDAAAGTDYRLNGPDYVTDYVLNDGTTTSKGYSYTFVPQVTPVGQWQYTQTASNTDATVNQYERSVSKNTIAYEIFEDNQWKVYIYYQPTDTLFCLTDRLGNTTNDRQPSVLETTYTTANGVTVPHIHITWSSYNAERDNYEIYYSDVILDNVKLDDDQMQPVDANVVPDFSDLAINWVCVTQDSDLTNRTDDINPQITSLGTRSNRKADIAIVWTGHDSAGRSEVFYASGIDNITNTPGIAVKAVTSNNLVESCVQIHGRYILWVQEQSARKSIFLYDTTTEKLLQVTSAGINDNPVIGSVVNADGEEEYFIAWEYQNAAAGSETYVELRRIINPVGTDSSSQIRTDPIKTFNAPGGLATAPSIGGEWLVWEGKQANGLYHIYAYNFVTTQLRDANTALDVSLYDVTPQNNGSDNRAPTVFGNRVVWQSHLTEKYGSAASQVIRYADIDIASFIPVTLSDVSNTSFTPTITESGMVVWKTQDIVSKKFSIVMANQDDPVVTGIIHVPIIGNTTVNGDREFRLEIVPNSITKVNNYDVAKMDSNRSTATVTILEDDGYVIQDTNRNNVGGLDFGDAPASYGTLLQDDGARHAVSGYYNDGSLSVIGYDRYNIYDQTAYELQGPIIPNISLFRPTTTARNIAVDVETNGNTAVINAKGDNDTYYNDENGIAFIKKYEYVIQTDENGEPRIQLNADGSYVVKTDKDGNAVYNEYGNPVYVGVDGKDVRYYSYVAKSIVRDKNGQPVPKTDDEGNVVLLTDQDGNPIPVTYADGRPYTVVKKDENGNILKDKDNNPIYEPVYQYEYLYEDELEQRTIYYTQNEIPQWARNDTVEIDVFALISEFPAHTENNVVYLKIWVDWNGDGIFSEDTELVQLQIKGDNYEGGNYLDFRQTMDGIQQRTLQITVPYDAALGKTYLRARLTTDQDIGPNGWAPDGEVEDYCINIIEDPYKDQSAYINDAGILYIRGTELDDNITITRQSGGWVTVTFASQEPETFNEADIQRVIVDTRGGTDTVTVNGLASDAEDVLMRPNKATITTNKGSANEYVISIDNAEHITFDGGSAVDAKDTVTMFDSRGNDIAELEPNKASIKSPNVYSNTVKNVYAVTMFSELGGTDSVKVTTNSGDTKGNAADVHYIGNGDTYVNKAQGFAFVEVDAAALPASLPQAATAPVAVSSRETELLEEQLEQQIAAMTYGTVFMTNIAQTVDVAVPVDVNAYIDLIDDNGMETVFDDLDVDAELLALMAVEGSQQSSDLANDLHEDWLDEMLQIQTWNE